jgi:solute carrier family 9 (sodium/hydrogen exchanger), member 6/7
MSEYPSFLFSWVYSVLMIIISFLFEFSTLSQVDPSEEITLLSIFHGIGLFLLSFFFSMALGVLFGLFTSLTLKHSSLSLFPSIETCLVALSAYTCYFLSNCLPTSGIVSLLFCGITLKHYAYHTMSRRTQKATKWIFATVAQLTENFIFVYLGMALFTSAPTRESAKVSSYVKPVFIVVSTIAVIATRYAAVFPLASIINFFHRHFGKHRTTRGEELPHSYQMMLFWAGLRGAVGVALAAGFKGENAHMLRFTVLVVVVVTVVVFGGTTAKMLEVLGIRTGVADEEGGESDDEEYPQTPGAIFIRGHPQSASGVMGSPGGYRNERGGAGRIGSHYIPSSGGRGGNNYWNHHQHQRGEHEPFNLASEDSDSDAEVLPLAPTHLQHDRHHHHHHSTGNGNGKHPLSIDPTASSDPHRTLPPGAPAGESSDNVPTSPAGENEGEAKWFQALDERYLLPLFSNATASRTFHARRARRSAANSTANLHGGHHSSSNLNLNLHHNSTGSLSRLGGGGGRGGGERGGSVSGESSMVHSPTESDDEGEPVELGVPLGLGRGGMDNQRVERPPQSPMASTPRAGGHRGSGSRERLE